MWIKYEVKTKDFLTINKFMHRASSLNLRGSLYAGLFSCQEIWFLKNSLEYAPHKAHRLFYHKGQGRDAP